MSVSWELYERGKRKSERHRTGYGRMPRVAPQTCIQPDAARRRLAHWPSALAGSGLSLGRYAVVKHTMNAQGELPERDQTDN